ncbi:MAG: hypothetical protein V1709_02015 [Planctomycetota bacterium]
MRISQGIIFIIILSLSGCVSVIQNNENWLIKETDHLIIYYKPNSFAAHEIDTAAKTYEEVCNRAVQMLKLTDTFNKKINCYLLETMPQWAGKVWGYAIGSNRSVYYYYSDRKKFISAHEMMHILLNDINTNVPSCLQEGICRFYEKRTIIMISPQESNNTKEYSCELYRLAKFEPPNEWTVENAFSSPVIVNETDGNIAAAFVSFLINYMGDELFYYLYRKIDSTSWENVLTTTLHLSVNEINQAFQEYGKSIEDPPMAICEYYGKIVPHKWEK